MTEPLLRLSNPHDPLTFHQRLHGPIIADEKHCRWSQMGPLFLGRNAANTIAWAHYRCRNILPMATMGPVFLERSVANTLAWAHYR